MEKKKGKGKDCDRNSFDGLVMQLFWRVSGSSSKLTSKRRFQKTRLTLGVRRKDVFGHEEIGTTVVPRYNYKEDQGQRGWHSS